MARARKRQKARKIVVINKPRNRRRKSAVRVVQINKRRARRNPDHRSRKRTYRRNPGLPSTGFLMDAAYVTGGFFATRMAAGFVLPMIPGAGTMPIVRILGKGATAWGLGFLGGKILSQRAGQLLLLGGLVETLSDAVRTYISPFVPALSDEGVGSYPELSSYPTLGDAYSNPYAVGNTVNDYDEAL